MTASIAVLVSGASGAVVTLVGVVTGGVIASRSQRRQWLRDKQVDACAVVVQESTAMQLALRDQWRHQELPDWTAWNQAPAMIWLVGTSAVRTAARQMDRAFWLCGAQIKNGQLTDEDAWAVQRDAMELSRRDPVGEREQVSDVPVARPPLAEIRQMFGSAAESDSKGAANLYAGDDDG